MRSMHPHRPHRPHRPRRPSERQRTPPPLIRTRLPSRRGAIEQPNVGGPAAELSPRFWAVLLAVGVATGLTGAG